MAEYSLTFSRSARKELESLPNNLIQRIFPKIENLCACPRPNGCAKLHGGQELWRIRIGEYRVVYTINDVTKRIDVTSVRHRRDVYRN